jgi:hypothetical protein
MRKPMSPCATLLPRPRGKLLTLSLTKGFVYAVPYQNFP